MDIKTASAERLAADYDLETLRRMRQEEVLRHDLSPYYRVLEQAITIRLENDKKESEKK